MELELYARILAELARGQSELQLVLARYGLSEEQWALLSAQCEVALDVPDDSNDASGLERFAAAFAAAQAELAGGPASFEEWLEVLAALQRGESLPAALERLKLTLDRYLATQAHWAPRVAKDARLNARMQAVLAQAQRR
ncbi:MAG TPA: hypothetical protein VER11_17155 [Polyangiaceae bacterium]|nr:hypothetical protein [Polyangiaceae bacterium]